MSIPNTTFSHFRATEKDATRRHALRTRVETMLDRAQHLHQRDRLILEQVYRHGLSAAEVARLLDQPPDRVRRRIARLLKLIQKPEFEFLSRHEQLLPPLVRRSCQLVVFQGVSLRQTAQLTDQTLHEVRKHLSAFHALARF